jgi:hypothetical protein
MGAVSILLVEMRLPELYPIPKWKSDDHIIIIVTII